MDGWVRIYNANFLEMGCLIWNQTVTTAQEYNVIIKKASFKDSYPEQSEACQSEKQFYFETSILPCKRSYFFNYLFIALLSFLFTIYISICWHLPYYLHCNYLYSYWQQFLPLHTIHPPLCIFFSHFFLLLICHSSPSSLPLGYKWVFFLILILIINPTSTEQERTTSASLHAESLCLFLIEGRQWHEMLFKVRLFNSI